MTRPGRERDIQVGVTVRADTRGADQAARALGGVDKAAGRAGASMHGMEVDARTLNAEIERSTRRVRELQAELLLVGDNKGLRKALRVERSWLTELERIGKDLIPAAIEIPAASLDLGALRGAAMPAVAGFAALAAPLIGGAIAGAVVGAVGLGGIAGGIAAASRSSEVQGAWADFSQGLEQKFFASGGGLEKPIVDALGRLSTFVQRQDLAGFFGKGASAVGILEKGVEGAARALAPGLSAAMEKSDDYARILSDGLVDISDALSGMLVDLSANEGAQEALQTILIGTADAIRLTTDVLDGASTAFHGFAEAAQPVAHVLEAMYGWLPLIGDAAHNAADNVDEITGSGGRATGVLEAMVPPAQKVAKEVEDAAAAFDKFRGSLDSVVHGFFDVPEAEDAVADATARLTEQIKQQREEAEKGAGSLDRSTDAGRRNFALVTDLTAKYADMMAAYDQAGMSTEGLSKKLEDQLVQLGFSRAAAHDYAVSLDAVKSSMDKIPAVTVKTLKMIFEEGVSETARETRRLTNPARRATGGPVMADVPYMINERGRETVTFPASGTVHPAQLTPVTAGRSITNYITINAAPLTSPAEVGAAVVAALRQYEMANGTGWRA